MGNGLCYRGAIGLVLVGSLAAAQEPSAQPEPEAKKTRDFNPVVAVPGDRFQAITDFPSVAADATELNGDELVLGVEVNGKSRAYPINMLTGPSREILNDKLGGRAIAATW